MALHWARIAHPSQWKPELRCCAMGDEAYAETTELFQIDPTKGTKLEVRCQFCGAIRELTMVVHPTIGLLALEELDIDEAPCPPSA